MYICSEKKKKLFCAFIDYKKAFDSVQRGLLWGKLLNSGVNGKVLHVIRDMYAKAKSCVKTRHGLSQFFFFFFFVSNFGLRQGENLSPVLFSLFLNDLKGFLTSNNVQGLKLPFALAQDVYLQDIDNFLYLFLLLYADDTILLAECPQDLGGGDSSVVRAPDSWLKGRGFESLLERRENFLLQGRLSVLTLISVSVPPPCYHSST